MLSEYSCQAKGNADQLPSHTPLSNWKTVPPCIELPWVQKNSSTSFCVDGVEKKTNLSFG